MIVAFIVNIRLKILFYYFLLLTGKNLSAQFYLNGTENPLIKLREINTEHFQVVFPKGYEKEGNKLANLLEMTYTLASRNLEHQLNKKIPVLLRTGTSISNGFVAIAPFRSELNNTPPQENLSQEWLTHLAIHEMRHIIQIDKINQDVCKMARILFGEAAGSVISGLFPIWAYEGDAVVTETSLTRSGRGRDPSFLSGVKANLLENKKYFPYEKAIFGSYKDFVPDYYVYGYLMSATARIQYDSLFWKNMLEYIPRKPYTLYPTYFAMKKEYGLSKHKLYQESLNFFRSEWGENNSEKEVYKSVNSTEKNEYISYRFPVIANDGNIICEKSDMAKINQFIYISSEGNEKKIIIPGRYLPTRLSFGGGKIVWSELHQHPRWELEDMSVIKIYNTGNGKIQTIGRKSKYMAPSIDIKGEKVVAVETGRYMHENIVIFDVESKKIEYSIPVSNGEVQMPSWNDDRDRIVYTRTMQEGKVLEIMEISSGKTSVVLGPETTDISNPVFWRNYIIFSASFSGTNDIYAIHIDSHELFRLTFSQYGAYHPSINTNSNVLYFSEYTSQGYNVVFKEIDEKKFLKYNKENQYESDIVKKLAVQEQEKFPEKYEISKDYSIENYSRLKHLVHMHSWIPFYAVPEVDEILNNGVYPGITAFTQNLTGTLYGWTGYSFREKNHFLNSNLTYRGMWPVITINFQWGGIPDIVQDSEHADYPVINNSNNKELKIQTYVPLFFNKGPLYFRFQPGIDLTYDDTYFYHENADKYKKGFATLQYGASFFLYSKMAKRDLYPRYGLLGRGRFFNTPWEENFGNMYYGIIQVYLPGIGLNHSLRFTGQYQKQNEEKYYYPYSVSFPRGYDRDISGELTLFAADYTMPLIYPDWRIGKLAYIKRITMDLFWDQAFIRNLYTHDAGNPFTDEFIRSWGVELKTDFHAFHIIAPFSAGIRIIYKQTFGEYAVEPIFTINLDDL